MRVRKQPKTMKAYSHPDVVNLDEYSIIIDSPVHSAWIECQLSGKNIQLPPHQGRILSKFEQLKQLKQSCPTD
jgi:hypothetical protein